MNAPRIQSVVDLAELQNSVALALLSDDRVICPVLPEYKLQMESELSLDVLWTVPRAALAVGPDGFQIQPAVSDEVQGPVGAGLLVEMPEARTLARNAPGPAMTWQVHVVAFEDRNMNWLAGTGTLVTAEQYCLVALDVLHLCEFWPFGTLAAVPVPVAPAHDWMTMKPGIMAYRATLECSAGRGQSKRTPVVSIVVAGGVCTLACADAGAEVRYTLDGSAPVKANPSALVYKAPFGCSGAGQVRAAAWKAGQVQGPLGGQTTT